MHLPAQASSPGGQLVTQVPAEQAWPATQTVPQVPQFIGSLFLMVQNFAPPLAEQASGVVAGQEQVPPEHCCPASHTAPHTPQLFASTWVFAQ
jgi:hypothetical protein